MRIPTYKSKDIFYVQYVNQVRSAIRQLRVCNDLWSKVPNQVDIWRSLHNTKENIFLD